jgi:hypothetical protein
MLREMLRRDLVTTLAQSDLRRNFQKPETKARRCKRESPSRGVTGLGLYVIGRVSLGGVRGLFARVARRIKAESSGEMMQRYPVV